MPFVNVYVVPIANLLPLLSELAAGISPVTETYRKWPDRSIFQTGQTAVGKARAKGEEHENQQNGRRHLFRAPSRNEFDVGITACCPGPRHVC